VAELPERFRGCLLGLALGDALGAPYEFTRPEEIPQADRLFARFGRLMDLPVGTVTDDTQMTLALAQSLIERGRVDGEDAARRFAELWQRGLIIGPGLACSEAMGRILGGVEWDRAGCPDGRAGNGAAMRVAPVGLLRWQSVDTLLADARAQSIITHTDKRAVAGAAVVARAVSLCLVADGFDVGDFVRELVRVAALDSPELATELARLPGWLEASPEEVLPEIARVGQPAFADRVITPFIVPTVAACFYAFLRTPRDFQGSVSCVIGFGGDTDSTAAITGAISGSLNGEAVLPEELLRHLRIGRYRPNLAEELRHVADELYRIAASGEGAGRG
jgi:ADP-ribosyl-[dinitrogen reductase] hydrolase